MVFSSNRCLTPDDISRMFEKVRDEFAGLEIFVSNARTDLPLLPEAVENHAGAVGHGHGFAGQGVPAGGAGGGRLMSDEGRVIAILLAAAARELAAVGGDGSAKAALESLVRYFAVALPAPYHRQRHQPRRRPSARPT